MPFAVDSIDVMQTDELAQGFEMRAARPHVVGVRTPRLLACDIDGTLLDETGALRPAVKAAISSVRAAGVEVVLATGRSPWAVAETARALGLRGPQIVMNGGAYVSPATSRLVWARRLSPGLVIDGLTFARGLGSAPLLGFINGHACQRVVGAAGSGGVGGAAAVPDFAVGPRLREVDSLDDLALFGPIRMYMPTAPWEHARALAEAADWFGDRASIVFSDEFGIEVMAPGTNKGQALRAVAEVMGIERGEVAAMGDGPNDREMLEYAGHSAALLPAPGSLIEKSPVLGEATHVVPSSAHDGAVEGLRRFFPDLDFGPTRLRPVHPGERPARPDCLPRPPDPDDDPEPDMDSTAA